MPMEREKQEQEGKYELQKTQNQMCWKSPFKLLFHLFVVGDGRIQEPELFLRPHPLSPQSRVSSAPELIKEASVAGLKPQGVSALSSQYRGYRYTLLCLAVFT